MVKTWCDPDRPRRRRLERNESENASSITGIIKVVVRFPKPPPQPPDPDRIPAVFLLGYEIVHFVEDFYTLYSLSRTCKTFYKLVSSSPVHRDALFDRLERPDPPKRPSRWNEEDDICRQVRLERRSCESGVYISAWRRQLNSKLCEANLTTDMVRYGGLTFDDILRPRYLPCYGCKQFKSSSEYLPHRKDEHLVLLGCRHDLRLCIDCEFAKSVACHEGEMDDSSDNLAARLTRYTRNVIGLWRRYLIDMPKGYPGFRQHCQVCKSTRWARVRPSKAQEARQVCGDCYRQGMSSTKSRRINHRKKESNSGDESVGKAKETEVDDDGEITDDLLQNSELDNRVGGSGFDVLQDYG